MKIVSYTANILGWKSTTPIGCACSRRAARVAVATLLAWASWAHAFQTDPGECQGATTARLSATPAYIDRETSPTVVATLAWSVVMPKGCPVRPGLYLAGRPVGLSGQLSLEVTSTTTYELKALLLHEQPTLATATVTVHGDPGLITVSGGPLIRASDIAKFNAKWMQPFQLEQAKGMAGWSLLNRFDAGAWWTGERMAAMARMYDLTRDPRYLNHLRELIKLALDNRDDKHTGFKDQQTGEEFPPKPLDEFRARKGLPAWGGKSGNSGGFHRVDEVVSSVYAYPIAAFARIVAEDPSLHDLVAEDPSLHETYGELAVRYANAVFETVQVFLPQIRDHAPGKFPEAYLAALESYRTKPTASDCEAAYKKAVEAEPANESRWKEMQRNCNSLRVMAGLPLAHNENLAFAMVLIELSRALESPYYRQAPTRLNDHDVEPLRTLIPFLVSRQQRYFANRLSTEIDLQLVPRFFWHFSSDLPPGTDLNYYPEDTSHGALDMRYLGLLRRDFARLNAMPASVGEPIALDDSYLRRFANTFLQMIALGTNFRNNVSGATARPVDRRNSECDGWLNLAVADVRVYNACHEMSLRVVNGEQPYLNIGNHSALLMNKHVLPFPSPEWHAADWTVLVQ